MSGRKIKHFKDPQSTDTDINLLLLGETGVGKSTFINSISNYFKYSKFTTAQKGNIEVLIPVHLNLSDYDKICGNPDKNEKHESGASATQHVKVYLFPIKMDGKDFNLRLVDTPGVGDPRGIEQDNTHIDNILSYLATLKKLHGICFVMKSNQSRLTSFVEYCLKQILTRLDKSASNNIIFITTYSKTAQYTAGETKFHCLQPLVKNIKSKPPHVTIPLSDKNVFSLDNEAFKALLEMQEGKTFSKHDIQSFTESWTISMKECRRLLTYIIGDSKSSALKPHEVENTISINEVRFLIEQLSTPIAEVSELIQDNLRLLDRHKKSLNLEDQTLGQLKQQLYMPCIDLEVTELDQPITVCTDSKCAEVVKVYNVTQWHYDQKCHDPCYLDGIPKEMVGDPGIIECAAMGGTNSCTECGCDWRLHMHIYKTTEKVEVQKVDENVRDAIRDKEDARFRIEALMKDLNKKMKELENEGEIISESIAKYSYFLQEHALTPFNDAYSDYIKQLIKNEKHLGKFTDQTVIENLLTLLIKHEHLQKTFQDSAKKFQTIGGQSNLTPQAIKKSISDLYNLKHMGKKIEELIKKTTACRSKETQKNFNCIVSQQIDLSARKNFEKESYQGAESMYTANEEYYGNNNSKSARQHRGKPPRSPVRSEYGSTYYDDEYKSSVSEYSREPKYESSKRSTRSIRSSHAYNSDDDKSVKSSSTYHSSGSGHASRDPKYESRKKSTKSSNFDSDEEKSSISHHSRGASYESKPKSVRSSRSHSFDSDEDSTVTSSHYSYGTRHSPKDPKYVSSSKSTRSFKMDSDDDKTVKSTRSEHSLYKSRRSDYDGSHYEASVKSGKSLRSKNDSDDESSVKSSRKKHSTYRTEKNSRNESSKTTDPKYESTGRSIKSSKSRNSQQSDDEKSLKSQTSEYSSKSSRPQYSTARDPTYETSNRSERSSKSERHRNPMDDDSDDGKSVRSSKSQYSIKLSKSEYSSRKNPTQEFDDKSERSSKSRHQHRNDKDSDDDKKSVRSTVSEYYSKRTNPSEKNYGSEYYYSSSKVGGKRGGKSKSEGNHTLRTSETNYYSNLGSRSFEKSNDTDSFSDEPIYDSIEK